MRVIKGSEAREISLRGIGLDPSKVDVFTVEAIASSLRRAAAFFCPCSEQTLVKTIMSSLEGLVSDPVAARGLIEECLEALISYGDLLQLKNINDEDPIHNRAVLYTSPPSFVTRKSGSIMLLGVGLDSAPILPPELESQILHFKHMRILVGDTETDLPNRLTELGLIELSMNTWLKLPMKEQAEHHIEKANIELLGSNKSGNIPHLILLDTSRPVNYYRGRWVEPKDQTGRFIGRRKQAYGQDIWCYIEMHNGEPIRFIDLPFQSNSLRGCDEAWRLQAALDFLNGSPQLYSTRECQQDHCFLEFFSPIPMWAGRRLDSIGEPISLSGSLFSYKLSKPELSEELQFIHEYLWMKCAC